MNEELHIFDLDGTVADFTENPANTIIDPRFIAYARKTKDVLVVLTGREDKRTNPHATSLTCDTMLAELLAERPVNVVSCHGLALVDETGKVTLHPALEAAQPYVQAAHAKISEHKERLAARGVVFEDKITGQNINVNGVAEDEREAVLNEAAMLLAEFVTEESDLQICAEHGSVELRPKTGKRDGLLYFIEQGLVPGKDMDWVFHCDSLKTGGTDRELADYITNGSANEHFRHNAHSVVHVHHGKGRYPCAAESYVTPGEHCDALLERLISRQVLQP